MKNPGTEDTNYEERIQKLEGTIEYLKPVFDLAHLTKENGMKDSMEYIVSEASKTGRVYMDDMLNKLQKNLDALKVSMVFGGDYNQTK